MTHQEELYFHFATSVGDLNYARRILREVRAARGTLLAGAAFRFALIAYARPYRASRGSLPKNYKLDDRFVPTEHRDLHRRILDARDQVHAHSDLTIREAKIHVVKVLSEKLVTPIQNIITGLEEIANIDLIITMIEQTLDGMYAEEKRLEAALPVNS